MNIPATLVIALTLSAGVPAAAGGVVRGRVVDPAGLPLPGVLVTFASPDGRIVRSVTTVSDGEYDATLPEGRYVVRAELSGFETPQPRNVTIGPAATVVDFSMALASFSSQVTVTSEAPRTIIDDSHPDAPVVVTREIVDAAMLPNSQYDDVLTLMPNVLRGPDGQISVAGARAPQGALVVNGTNETDPTTGAATLMLPLESVDALQVYAGGYPAAFGRATGGVTSVVTRSGADRFKGSANSFFPRLLFDGGGIHGVEYWEPNAGASGPIARNHAYFEQGLSYRFDRNRFTTLSGPQVNQYTALMSWTQLDLMPGAGQHLVASFATDPQHSDRANITAFTTAGSAPMLDQRAVAGSIADRVVFGRDTLELRASSIDTRTTLVANGTGGYRIAHDATSGSYYDAQDLRGRRTEGGITLSKMFGTDHTLTAGATVARVSIDTADASQPVDLLRSDGALARRVVFGAAMQTTTATDEVGGFVQDSWSARPWLTVDSGVRVDRTGASAGAVVSPRASMTARPGDGRTTVAGSVGLFADKIVLSALAFPAFPARTVAVYTSSGPLLAPPVTYANAVNGPFEMPTAVRWDLQVNREFGGGFTGRVKYAERHGSRELVVAPEITAPGQGLLVLSSSGISTGRSLETTIGYRAASGQQLYVSYVRASTRGNLNSFEAIGGLFSEPFVQPDQVGPLAADVPNRLLVWGVLHAPWRLTVAPFVEARNGFPYSAVDDTWAYVGARNDRRLPWFGSLDVHVNRIVGLPGRLPHARVGVKIYNVASVNTEREAQRDIARAEFGQAYNPIPRDFTFVFELLWGRR